MSTVGMLTERIKELEAENRELRRKYANAIVSSVLNMLKNRDNDWMWEEPETKPLLGKLREILEAV